MPPPRFTPARSTKTIMELIDLAKRKIPISIQVGDSDEFFPLKDRARDARCVERLQGFPVELIEITNHDHWYYDQASKFNQTAWEFLKKYELDDEPSVSEVQLELDKSFSC